VAGKPMTVLRIVLTPVLFGEAPAFRGKRGSSGRVAACGDRCPRQKVALIATEPFAIMQIAPCSFGNQSGDDLAQARTSLKMALSSSHTLAGLRRRHRFKAGRRDLLIPPVPGLGEGVQSCERRVQRERSEKWNR
jgi:hypothetical protein